MDEPRAWWEWILLGVIAAGFVVAIVGGTRRYKRQHAAPKKKQGPGGRAS